MTNETQMWLTEEEAEIIFKLRKIPKLKVTTYKMPSGETEVKYVLNLRELANSVRYY